MTVALSRARLGLYVVGRRNVFESCYELSEAFSRLISSRPTQLELVTGEMWPAQRKAGEDPPEGTVIMEDIVHLGQYVYEMTLTAVEKMKQEAGILGKRTSQVSVGGARKVDKLEDPEQLVMEAVDEEGEGKSVHMEL